MLDIIYDAQYLLLGIFGTVEFLLGISYVAGKYLTASVLQGGTALYQILKESRVLFESGFQILVELLQTIVQTVFLMYFGIGHIADAFYITSVDFLSFVHHAGVTIGLLVESGWNLLLSTLTNLIMIPNQVFQALALIGDFVLGFVQFLGTSLRYGALILITVPSTFARSFETVALSLITLPFKILSSIPVSAHVGLAVILVAYFIYCKFSLRRFFSSMFNLSRRGFMKIWPQNRRRPRVQVTPDGKGSRDSNGICVVCFENPVCFLASPCNHISLCNDCCHELVRNDNRCPLCRKHVKTYTRVFIS